jgi:aminoglycoside 6-adenylyltransferase
MLFAHITSFFYWYIGMQTNFHRNPGKQGKYFQTFLSTTQWDSLLKTYADADIDHNWEALYTMAELFQTVALQVADRFHFSYPDEECLGVLEFLKNIQRHSLKGRNGL